MKPLKRQFNTFLIVGITTVAMDWLVYRLLLWSGMPVAPAKTISFLAGATFAFYANRSWTFQSRQKGIVVLSRFTGVYLATLIVNVLVNSMLLYVIGPGEIGKIVAFLGATTLSATLNFIGMKFLVFANQSPEPDG
ncbi:MAG: GtrA family protein [Magnetococcus sp. DMHC-1]|nr:GtrA family protein [Magnetococcales bacterium]